MIFKTIGVIGGGTMGQGIVEMLAAKGLEVKLVEKTAEKLQDAYDHIVLSLDKQLEKWAITESEKKLILSRIKQCNWLADLSDCEMIIETISEELEAKKEVFQKLCEVADSNAILASNTSTLSLTELAASYKHPERVIGLHFLHPVARIDVVEIIRGIQTSEEVFNATKGFVQHTIQKKGIRVYESPGFITTRLICTFINEAMHILEEGVASAEDIDTAMSVGYSFKHGPLEMCDRFGLDSVLAALDRMFREYGELKYRPSYLLKQMVRAGRLGVKTGEGFFKYDKDGDRL